MLGVDTISARTVEHQKMGQRDGARGDLNDRLRTSTVEFAASLLSAHFGRSITRVSKTAGAELPQPLRRDGWVSKVHPPSGVVRIKPSKRGDRDQAVDCGAF